MTSKRLQAWLADFGGEYLIVSPYSPPLDPLHKATQIKAPIGDFCQRQSIALEHGEKANQRKIALPLRALASMNLAVGQLLEDRLDSVFSELSIVRSLARILPPDSALFVGNSLCIRLVDMFASPSRSDPDPLVANRIYSNRGASGIDGLLATAMGCAQQHGNGLTLLLGDLSLLHDLNSLALASKASTPMVIVVLNNDGGAIFNLLPVDGLNNVKTDLFQCPHGLNFEGACQMFSIHYDQPTNLESFSKCYSQAMGRGGCSLIEAKLPSNQSTDEIKQILLQVSKVANKQ